MHVGPSFCKVARSAFNTAGLDSTITTSAAPRDAASKPIAPLPANRSRQCFWLISCPNQLKTVSRTRSGVGRRSISFGKVRTRLRHSPPMIRILFLIVRATKNEKNFRQEEVGSGLGLQKVLFTFHSCPKRPPPL